MTIYISECWQTNVTFFGQKIDWLDWANCERPHQESSGLQHFYFKMILIPQQWDEIISNALSVYRSQNVLCRSKFIEPAQKFIYILCQSQTFWARQKKWFAFSKIGFVPAQKFLKRHWMQSNFWAGSKNLDRHKKFWYL